MTTSLSRQEYNDYYKEMSNSTLWPLMHELGEHIEENAQAYITYRDVNKRFAQSLTSIIQKDDIIWVHDYHLIPLGEELRRLGVKNRILFFQHIPVPAVDFVYDSVIPSYLKRQYRELMNSLFSYDLVGFQSLLDLRNFMNYFHFQAPLPERYSTIVFGSGSRRTHFGAFPISIETAKIERQAEKSENCPVAVNVKAHLNGRRLIIGAERLDYTKGLPHRIKGISSLLTLYPEHREKIQFLQIAPLSRNDVEEYRDTAIRTRATVKRIEKRFGHEGWHPVEYTEKSVPRDQLIGCFRLADVGLVTPLIDGQNLVAKEFLAAQNPENPGVLVLSKNAGAAEELGELGTILVDPYNPEDIARKTNRALQMPREKRIDLHQAALTHLRQYDIGHWVNCLLDELPFQAEAAYPLPKIAGAYAASGAARSML